MARITPLWRSAELRVYRFDHPVEHEDQGYQEVSPAFRASFVECGTFDLEVGEPRLRVAPGDVMLSHPGMRFRAGFQGKGFNDVCLSIVYEAANEDRFDVGRSWATSERHVLRASNRLRYLRWALRRAVDGGSPMLAEYCATRSSGRWTPSPPLFSATASSAGTPSASTTSATGWTRSTPSPSPSASWPARWV